MKPGDVRGLKFAPIRYRHLTEAPACGDMTMQQLDYVLVDKYSGPKFNEAQSARRLDTVRSNDSRSDHTERHAARISRIACSCIRVVRIGRSRPGLRISAGPMARHQPSLAQRV
jgi:hypothetical protein